MKQNIRVRFAPSPTGPLHIGGVRTALYNYLLVKKLGGSFILRIEDTDQNRFVPGAQEYIIEALKWLGIEPNEGVGFGDGPYAPYRQSDRKDMYAVFAKQLVESGHAYYAFDTPEELQAMRDAEEKAGNPKPQYNLVTRQKMKNSLTLPDADVKDWINDGKDYVIRLKVPADEKIVINDLIRGEVTFDSNQLDDKILLKSDGWPTYHMANIVDDHHMKISHVIRGEEWLPSTPTHVLLYRGLGWEDTMPIFAHLPLILKPVGNGKLSKRDGAKFEMPVFPMDWKDSETGELARGFKEWGFLPEAVLNFLVFLGWHPGTEQELFTMDALSRAFDAERIGKSGARYNFDKAVWFNQQYLQRMSNEDLMQKVGPSLASEGYKVDEAFLSSFVELYRERASFVADFAKQGYYFFKPITDYQEKPIRKKWKPERRELFEDLRNRFISADKFDAEQVENTTKAFMEENGLGFGDVLPILRIALSGTMKGPPVFEVAALMGKETVAERLASGFDRFDAIKSVNS